MAQTTCVNCGEQFDGNFCGSCGQKAKVSPITWKGLIVELSSKWLGTDNRFYRTIVGLSIRPWKVSEEYLMGNRVRYIAPLAYLILMGFLYVLSFQVLGIDPSTALSEAGELVSANESSEEPLDERAAFFNDFLTAFGKNVRLLISILIPFLALSLHIFYKRWNYLENFLISSYLNSHVVWLSLLSNVTYVLFDEMFIGTGSLLSLAYYSWAIGKMHPQRSGVWTYLKPVLTWIVAYLGYLIFMMIVTAILFALRLPPS